MAEFGEVKYCMAMHGILDIPVIVAVEDTCREMKVYSHNDWMFAIAGNSVCVPGNGSFAT